MLKVLQRIFQNHYLWIALVTLLSIFFTGYHVGGFDHSIHIPFLKKALDPSLYPNDSFFELRHEHFSYFWYLFFPFYRAGFFYEVLFAAHIIATYATFFVLWRISYRLFKSIPVAHLTILFLMFPHIAFSGFPVVEFQTLNRTVVLPFVLYALDLVLQKKMIKAFFLLGVMYNFHVVTVNFLLIPAGLLLLQDYAKGRILRIPQALFFFLLGALPVISWRFGSSGLPFEIHKEWFWAIDQGILNNVFSIISTTDYVVLSNLGGVAIAIMMGYIYTQSEWSDEQKRLWFIGWISLLTVFITFVFYEIFPFTLLVQFQLTRAMVLTQIVFFMMLAFDMVKRLKQYSVTEQFLNVLIAILSVTPIFILLQQVVLNRIRATSTRMLLSSSILLLIIFSLGSVYGQLWKPGIHITPERTPWIDMQLWAQENTAQDAVFLTPPEIWWHTVPSWHVYSERSQVAALSDLLEIAFFPDYYSTWKERFDTVAPGARTAFTGNFLHNQDIVRESYYSLSEEDILEIQRSYGATYFVASNEYPYTFPIVYRNKEFTAYTIR